ncbi:hypothetical protein CLV67_111218 [Actinoplanes italicus]|uniref:Uncharacterized protein n=2 Tax=Actinoplanes italicus TaxID=113567 RepID=A0A2T0K7S2_9ACTN|nr:hypothetical protein CLV67_111218 [Actinoplanes italicus]
MPSPERADREQPSDTYVEMLMDGLRRDPSLRYTEVGRSMLIWLSAGIPRTSSLADLIDRVPPHCGVTIAQIARECAQWWNSFADDMDRLGELS